MIVDAKGNPFKMPHSGQMQTDEARLSGLLNRYSSHPSRGLTPARLAALLMNAEQGDLIGQCELAEDIEEKDGHVFAELQKRRRALLTPDRIIVPPKDATEAELVDVAMLKNMLDDMTDLDDLILGLSDAILKGFSCYELEWRYENNQHLPRFHWREPSWFTRHPDKPAELRLSSANYGGEALQPFGWISHLHAAKTGYVGRNALVRTLAWPYLYKNYSVRDLAEFLEIYGLPLRLGKYPTGAGEKEKSTLLRAVMSIGHNAGGIVPRGMDIEFQEAAKGGSDPFEAMINWCERTQSKAILGGTLTSQADGKSSTHALGNVHNEVRKELLLSDAKQLAATLTRDLIYPLYALNGKSFTGPHRMPRFEFDLTAPEDMAYYAEHLPSLVNMGAQIPVSWVVDKLKIPTPEAGEAILTTATTTPLAPLSALKENKPATNTDSLHGLSERLADNMSPVLEGLSQQVELMLTQADSLESLAEQLGNAQINNEQAQTIFQQAFVAAELSGRYEISENS